jgi:hypothetical protein
MTQENTDDETRRKFREALERKKSSGGAHAGPQAETNSTMKESSDARRRQFRRRSG